jgi:SAM-dependent methyltransferase
METVACLVCGSREADELYNLPDWMFERYDVVSRMVKCRQCGMIYQNPRFTQEELARFYPPEYKAYQPMPSNWRSWLRQKAIENGLQRRLRWATTGLSGGRLLDIGCANGLFPAYVQRKPGWKAVGVEINPEAADYARQHYHLEIFTGVLEEAHFNAGSFDVVTLWDVLEHLEDPEGALQEINRILKPGGQLVIRLPNADSREARAFGPFWYGFEPPRHLYVFECRHLEQLLKRNGFQVKNVTGRIGSYMNFVLSVRFFLTGKKVNRRLRKLVVWVLDNPVCRALAWPVFFLSSAGARGSSITLLAAKSGQAGPQASGVRPNHD